MKYTMLENNILSETVLVPRNLEGRKEKLKQYNIKLLSQEVIVGNLDIDDTFEEIPEELVKVKEIKGNVKLISYKGYIPSWLKEVKIYGSFYCQYTNLKSLENRPQYVGGWFLCSGNKVELELPKGIELKGKFINTIIWK